MLKYLQIGEFHLDKILMATGVVTGFLFGGWSQLLTVLLVIQGLDILTGFMSAKTEEKLSSKEMRKGINRKVGVWIVLVLAHMVDLLLFGGTDTVVMNGALFAYIVNEGLSVTENLGNIGVLVPESVTKYLAQVKPDDTKESK